MLTRNLTRGSVAGHVALDDKLIALRESDVRRKWDSLDDQRICLACGKVITGRMIEVQRDTQGCYLIRCPTATCVGTPRDRVYCPRGAGDFSRKI